MVCGPLREASRAAVPKKSGSLRTDAWMACGPLRPSASPRPLRWVVEVEVEVEVEVVVEVVLEVAVVVEVVLEVAVVVVVVCYVSL